MRLYHCDDADPAIAPGVTEVCDNSIDDDCDGLTDQQDSDCTPDVETCDNGIDDDLDGNVDCADIDCVAAAACEGDTCSNPLLVNASGVTIVTDTSTYTDAATGTCATQSGPDVVLTLELLVDSDVHIDTENSAVDTLLYVRRGTCMGGNELACDDDAVGGEGWSRLEFHALQPGTYYVFVDTKGAASGALTVNIAISDVSPRSLIAVADDPLLRMPGIQPDPGLNLEGPDRCMNCHESKNRAGSSPPPREPIRRVCGPFTPRPSPAARASSPLRAFHRRISRRVRIRCGGCPPPARAPSASRLA